MYNGYNFYTNEKKYQLYYVMGSILSSLASSFVGIVIRWHRHLLVSSFVWKQNGFRVITLVLVGQLFLCGMPNLFRLTLVIFKIWEGKRGINNQNLASNFLFWTFLQALIKQIWPSSMGVQDKTGHREIIRTNSKKFYFHFKSNFKSLINVKMKYKIFFLKNKTWLNTDCVWIN